MKTKPYLKAESDLIEVDGAVLVVEALLEGIHPDLLPLVERGRGVFFADALDAQVLEAVRHIRLGDLHRADAFLA